MSVNQVHLLGRCGQDPEIRSVGQNNVNRATFSLCTGSKYKTHEGREIDDTCWHNIVAWESSQISDLDKIVKGMPINVTGRLRVSRYTSADGIEKQYHEVMANKIRFLRE